MSFSNKSIFIIGVGNMGSAIIKGIQNLDFKGISYFDKDKEKLSKLEKEINVQPADSVKEGIERSDIIIFAVKPQNFNDIISETKNYFSDDHLIITIMAGIKISSIQKYITSSTQIVRAMPNTPALVKSGLTAICGNNEDDLYIAEQIFSSIGEVIKIQEEMMDTITALSGSGPAYVYSFIESFVNAALVHGISSVISKKLVYQTVKGALELLYKSDATPEELRKRVTSPGGVTEAALKEMEISHFDSILTNAVEAAIKRAKELDQ